ncbi:TPA: hypothetical protein IXS77_002661 [Enterococcus faecium]|nr:hypothetical protein [Enterococcus faecium]HBC2769995.1 hypothetical protein [Enterococcus faecium]
MNRYSKQILAKEKVA